MNLKKILSLLLCLCIIGCLTACGGTTVTSEIVIYEDDEDETDGSSKVNDTSSKNSPSSKEQSSSDTAESSSKKENSSKDDNGDEFAIPYYEFTKKNVTLDGKSAMETKGVRLYGAADSFSFTSKCAGDVTIEYTATIKNTAAHQGVYFAVYIDGKLFLDRHHVSSSGNGEISIPGVPFGTHTFQIFRQTEHTSDVINFKGANISGEPSAPKAKDFSIEFIGDSITAGYGSIMDVVEKTTEDGGAPWYQDSTKTYAFYLAQKLNANISVTAFSGIGIVKGFKPFTMPQIYPYYPDTTMAIPTKTINEPDLIIINLGTNDGWNGVSQSDFINGAVAFGKTVHEAHPKAKIVFYGGLIIDSSWNNSYASIASKLGGEAAGYYSYVNSFSCQGHPLASEQKAASEELYTFLKGKNLVK